MTGNGKVFISHAYQDNDACQPLLAALDSWDVNYWFQTERAEVDEQLSPLVEQAIAESDVFLRVLSAAAQASYWVRLETEAFQRLRRDAPQEQVDHAEVSDGDGGDSGDAAGANRQDRSDNLDEQDEQDEQGEASSDEVRQDDKGMADTGEAERGQQRIWIDVSLDGSVAIEPGEEIAAQIDMTRARGIFWRSQLQRAMGLAEPETETAEVPAISPGEVLSLVRAQAQSRLSLPSGDDRVVAVALPDRPSGAVGATGRSCSLVMLQGNNQGRIYQLVADRTTLGRSRDSDLFLEDLAVSRRHAALVRDAAGRFILYDENSKNGTFVNGESVTERVLEDGDSIRLGQCVLQFRLPRTND